MKERIMPIIALVVLAVIVVGGAMLNSNNSTETAMTSETKVEDKVPVEKEIIEREEKEALVVEQDGFRHVETPELILTYLGDAVSNNYNYATLDSFTVNEDNISLLVSTDAGITDCNYEIVEEDGTVLYKGGLGLSYGNSGGDLQQIDFNRFIFDGSSEMNATELKPEWKNKHMKFYLNTGLDTSIIVDVDMAL